MGLIILLGVIFLLYAALLALFLRAWHRMPTFSPLAFSNNQTKVSIIISARNEAKHIEVCLTSILNNNYPKELYEIIVVDDHSTDETFTIAQNIIGTQGKVIRLQDYLKDNQPINSYKKQALSTAIGMAKGKLIVATDADCICPVDWLSLIVSQYEKNKPKAIIAPVSLIPVNNKSALYYFQSLDFMTMQGITAACTFLKKGSMSNGANLAFEKTTFEEVNGYQGVDDLASGDDMFLVGKIKKKYPNGIQYLKSQKAIVKTYCQPDVSSFVNQRIRWASKSDKYEDKWMTPLLLVVYLFNLGLLIGSIFILFSPAYFSLFLFLFICKIITELIFLSPIANFYSKKNELFWFPFLQPFHILYIVTAGFLGKFGKYKWKGRSVR